MEDNSLNKAASDDSRLPVSLLCGFLGAGKTTLLKHILETKHEEQDFRCAVIVNDMAALNIDKSLIDQSALVQSDEVIAMQNGCFCCTLQSDLVDQITSLAGRNLFNYMLIEASGVSEPSQIAPLFDLCDDEHDPEAADHNHEEKQLGEVARLDTCVTVIDSAEFHSSLGSMQTYENGESVGTIAELMMEQVEFSNVVVVNKTDLIGEEQKRDIIEKIGVLNPRARVVEAVQSRVSPMEILNTGLYTATDAKEEFWMKATRTVLVDEAKPELLDCCETSIAKDGKKCCKSKSKNGKLIDSSLSQVQLEVVDNKAAMTRHQARFGITSFIYRARRPFHPGRLWDLFLTPFFLKMEHEYEEGDGEQPNKGRLAKQQEQARLKAVERSRVLGQLLRSKGFMWVATSHDIVGGWQQAGNAFQLKALTPWMGEVREVWEGGPAEEVVLPYLLKPGGGEWEHADRRQELVFIGQGLRHEVIQGILDRCLLNDAEMDEGPQRWQEEMAGEDRIHLTYLNVSIKEIE